MMFARYFAVAALVATLGGPLFADPDPNLARGFDPQKGFLTGDVDSVNLFNGNLVVTVPIGGAYQVGAGLSYGLTAVFNSNPWVFTDNCDDFGGNYCHSVASVHPRDNAGFGWRVSLGRLEPPGPGNDPVNPSSHWMYVAPDASEHRFYPTLHAGESVSDPSSQFTRDGSYLRLKSIAINGTPAYELDSPDGIERRFAKDGGEVKTIQDKFGNVLSVDTDNPAIWTLSDSAGRIQQIYFERPGSAWRVQKIVLTAFGGRQAEYDFHYTTGASLAAPCPAPTGLIAVDLLKSISQPQETLPDGSSSQTFWTFDYFVDRPASTDGASCKQPGSLKTLILPTKGIIEWTYQKYNLPFNKKLLSRQWSNGVKTRTLTDLDHTDLGTWRYETQLDVGSGPGGKELLNTVTNPLGFKTRHYYSVARTDDAGREPDAPWATWEFGLPLTHNVSDRGYWLSTQDLDLSGKVVRSTYVRYDMDSSNPTAYDDVEGTELLNQRVGMTHTVYDSDRGHFVDVGSHATDFDGFGHYSKVTTSGNFPSGGGRSVVTGWTPQTSSWLLNEYEYQEQIQGVAVARQEYIFDHDTGFLKCRRLLKTGRSRGKSDVLVKYTPCSASAGCIPGEASEEAWFGGDTARDPGSAVSASVGTGQDCDAGTAAPSYVYDYAYQSGVRSSTIVSGVKTLDVDIDPSGLPSKARDESGLATSFEFDLEGRLTRTTPPGGAATTTYNIHEGNSYPYVDRKVGPLDAPLEHEIWELDGLGRVTLDHLSLPQPDAAGAERFGTVKTKFNGMGWKVFVSERYGASNQNPKGTVYSDYDYLGRPGAVTTADGGTTTYAYRGVWRVSRTVGVWNGSKNALATTLEEYDVLGRLWQVTEAEPEHNGARTRYFYDVGGRLASVFSNVSADASTQSRTFRYDGRGFLTLESHPELASPTTYLYDAKGNVTVKNTPTGSVFTAYDEVGRVRDVRSAQANQLRHFDYVNGRISLAQAYNDREVVSSIPGDPIVLTCTRYEVRQKYAYEPSTGRLCSETTTLLSQAGPTQLQQWTQRYQYDDAGRVRSLGYPCSASMSCGARTMTTKWDRGRPYRVSSDWMTSPQFKADFTYSDNGTLNTVTHGNGVVFTQTMDTTGMARPASVSAQHPDGSVIWPVEDYQYDDAGDIRKIGAKKFVYDLDMRLKSATIPGAALPYRGYNYDVFGNLTRIDVGTSEGSISSSVTNTTSVSSNQLEGGHYDPSGNYLGPMSGPPVYVFDVLGQLASSTINQGGSNEETWAHFYDATGERTWSSRVLPVQPTKDVYELRGPSGEVLSEFTRDGSATTYEDYAYHEGQLFGSLSSDGTSLNFDLDHLGNVRLESDAAGHYRYRDFWPYGEIASEGGSLLTADTERMKFAGHQRDSVGAAAFGDQLDYMHARYYKPLLGRFLAVDRHDGDPEQPQSWNRYSYAFDGPMKYVDPDGESAVLALGGFAGGAELAGAAAVGGGALAAGVGWGSYKAGRLIGGINVGEGTVDSHISTWLAAGITFFGKSSGGGRDSEYINKSVDELKEMLKAATGKEAIRIIRELKNRGERNKGKARGGRREPKKPPQKNGYYIGGLDSESGSEALNMFTPWELQQLSNSNMSLDPERAAACGVGVTCPF